LREVARIGQGGIAGSTQGLYALTVSIDPVLLPQVKDWIIEGHGTDSREIKNGI
jgi:hypothetical protein